MRRSLLLACLLVSMAVAGTDEMTGESLSQQLYVQLELDNIAKQVFEPLVVHRRARSADPSLLVDLTATFRDALTLTMTERFSDDELRTIQDVAAQGGELPGEFFDWLKEAMMDATNAAFSAHQEGRSDSADHFRIESLPPRDSEQK